MGKAKKKLTPDNSAKPETPPFDLRVERWIPVVRLDGTREELNLVDALLEAHQLGEVSDSVPTVEFGLYRLLVALVLDIFEPSGLVGLKGLRDAGSLDESQVRAYFKKYANRFDLFHNDFPFLQTAGMDAESAKPLAGLLHPIPSGTNATHFHHGHENDFGVCPAAAARLLTTIAPFMTAGGAGLSPSINGSPPWYVLPRGRSLFETLCLNLPVDRGLFPFAVDGEPPAWRSSKTTTPVRRTEASLIESLTWRPRRIQLIAGVPGTCMLTGAATPTLVKTMRFTAGFGAGFDWNDPHAAYVIKSDDVTIMRPKEGRAVWRDTGPLLLLRRGVYVSANGKIQFERPAIISQFAAMKANHWLDRECLQDVVVYGMRTDMKMKVFEWQREVLTLPTLFEWESAFHNVAQEEIERADSVTYALFQAIKRAYPRDGVGNSNAYANLIIRAQSNFWDSLRPRFDELLEDLGKTTDVAETLTGRAKWRERVKVAAWDALNDAIGDLDSDSDALERLAIARRMFASRLYFLLNPEAAGQAKTKKKQSKKVASK